ncbi:MAG: S-layer homology domain-containing protein [Clostridia bacterium]|nr:S-layer homology domain-containing protein [Clostridia bacterium]
MKNKIFTRIRAAAFIFLITALLMSAFTLFACADNTDAEDITVCLSLSDDKDCLYEGTYAENRDENGKLSLIFDESEEYYVDAYDLYTATDEAVIMPAFTTVTVEGGEVPEPPVLENTAGALAFTYTKGESASKLGVKAAEGVTYKWQSSSDGVSYTDIASAQTNEYTPPADTVGMTYYRVVAAIGESEPAYLVYTVTVKEPEPKDTFTVNAPEGAEVYLYRQIQNYNTERLTADKTSELGDGTVDHVFFVKKNTAMSFRASMEGKRTQAGYLGAVDGERVTVEFTDASPDEISDERAANRESSLLLNLNERGRLDLMPGESYKIRAYRGAWQIVNTIVANIMIEPDFSYNVLAGNDVITIETEDGGNAGDNRAWIKAEKEGVAIIEVTYDAIDILGSTATGNGFYGATDPARRGIAVVCVGDGYGDVDGIVWDAEYNTHYFFGDSGSMVISPVGEEVSVEVAHVNNGTLGEFKNAEAVQGGFKLPILHGNNIVRITADGITDHRVIRGARLKANIEAVSEDGKVYPGDEITIGFEGLYQPVPKFSGIYNPGFGNTMKTNYTLGDRLYTSKGTQYALIEEASNCITLTIPADAGESITLTGGKITGTSMGSSYGRHRELTDMGRPANFGAGAEILADIALPDLDIEVVLTELEKAKLNAKQTLESAYLRYSEADYTSENFALITQAYEKGIDDIGAAEDAYSVTIAKNSALGAMSVVERISGGESIPEGIGKTHTSSYYSTRGLDFDITDEEADGYVYVSAEDYGERTGGSDLAVPLGVLIEETKVPYTEGDTIADVTLRLLDALDIGYSHTGSVDGNFYLSSLEDIYLSDGYVLDSLGEFDSGAASGWMVSLNRWFINASAADYEVEAGDRVRWQYTCKLGADIGSDWQNPSAEIIGISFLKNYGTLSPLFDPDETDYTYTVSSSRKSISFEAELENYWSRVTYEADGEEYKALSSIPIEDGTLITVKSEYTRESDEPIDTDELTVRIKVRSGGSGFIPNKDGNKDEDTPKDTSKDGADTQEAEKTDDIDGTTDASADIGLPELSVHDYTDVSPDTWYYDSVAYVCANSLMNGVSENEFAPELTMTRAMLVTVLWRMDGENGYSDIASFDDVNAGAWYCDAVMWAAENGIVKGVDADTFAPDTPVTREQITAIMYRYAVHIGADVSKFEALDGFEDEDEIAGYAHHAFEWAYANGIISGTSETALSPRAGATRAQAAAILMRFNENL